MFLKLRSVFVCFGLLFYWSAVSAAQVPISIFPNPIAFGTVALNSTAYPATVYVSNTSVNAVNITGMTISGANGADFAFYSPSCTGLLPGGQTCEMALTFTPNAMGNISANLVIAFKGTGSPLTIPLTGTGGNPIPTITSLSPDSVYSGGPSFTLTLTGTGFLPSSVVYWENNTTLTSTYISSTQLTAQVPASDITGEGSTSIYVTNPPPAGGSFSATLQIVSLDPNLYSISPTALVAGSGASSIVVNGANFMPNSIVRWNGKSRSTTYLNSGQLQAQLTADDLIKPQIAQVSVSNPAPGGVSSDVVFDVTFPAKIRIVNVPANDLVWDPYAQRIYASVPSSFGSKGNSIAVINPANGGISGFHFAGSEPTKLALSADGQYLYAGLNGDGSVQRLILPSFALDINVGLGTSTYGGGYTASDLKVSPGDSHMIAVNLGVSECCGGIGPLEFFTDTTQLANSVSSPTINYFQFADASTLYGYTSGEVSQISVNATGGKLTQEWSGLVTGSGEIYYDAGLIYSSGGQVLNPTTGDLVGSYDVGGEYNSNDVFPESAVNRTFVLGTSPFLDSLGITSYNLAQFTPLAVINLSQLSSNNNASVTTTFIPWGNDGLAFIAENGCCGSATYQVVIVESRMMQPVSTTSNPVPVAVSLSPSSALHGGGNFQLTVNGSGFVPGSTATWNGSSLTVGYVSSTQLTVYVPGSDVASAGMGSVVITNPLPGGGKSSALTYTIE